MTGRRVHPAAPRACAACPWRRSNQGKRHPDGWFSKKNLRRLWARLRRGESMTCHPTDPNNPVPPGFTPAPAGAKTAECTGALILQQREVMNFQAVIAEDPNRRDALREYRRRHPAGMSREGLAEVVSRAVFAGTPFAGGVMTRPDLSDPDVGYERLTFNVEVHR